MEDIKGENNPFLRIDYDNFLEDLKSLFAQLYKINNFEEIQTLEYNVIENFKQRYLMVNIDHSKNLNIKTSIMGIFLENYILFRNKYNLEIYFNFLIDIIEIVFKIYSKKDLKYILIKNDFENLEMERDISIFENVTCLEKYFIYLGLNLNYDDCIYNSNYKNILNYKSDIEDSAKNILEHHFMQKNYSNYNFLIDLLIIELTNNCDNKYLSINLPKLITVDYSDSIISFKILVLNMIVYNKINNSFKIFNNILSNIIKIITNEADALSRKMNDILYNENFTDFEFNYDLKIRKLNQEEYKFLIKNFFPFLIFLIKNFLIDRNKFIFKDGILFKLNNTIFLDDCFICNNISSLFIIDYSDPSIIQRFYDILEEKLEINNKNLKKKDILNDEFNNKKNNQTKNLDNKIFMSYYIFAFSLDILDFIYKKFHILPESFKDTSDLFFNINPFIAYNKNDTPHDFEGFLNLMMMIFYNSVSNFSYFIDFNIKYQEIKTNNFEKIKELNDKSDSIYEIYEPLNQLGLSILIWILWKNQKQEIHNKLIFKENKKFFSLILSKINLFDSLLPIIAYLLKRSQNYKYMAFEILFDFLILLEPGSIVNLNLLKNYSYEDIYKDLLEYIGGPDPQIKRLKISNNFNNLLMILSDEMKKKLLIYILKENLKENTLINDQMNAYILHSFRIYLNDICNNYLNLNEDNKLLNSELFEERFLKEIIGLTFTTKLFVIDVFEIISQSINFIQFCVLKDKLVFNGKLKIYNKYFFNELEKESEKILFFIKKWNNMNDEDKMKQIKVDTSDFNNITDFTEKKKELQNNFNLKKNQGIITENLLIHINNFILKCKKEINLSK